MPQSVILLADVPGLGQLGDTCKVKDGYARNYLFPHKLAVVATPNQAKRFELQKQKFADMREKALSSAKGVADKLAKIGLVFERPVGQGGRLFGSVTPLDVAQELARNSVTVEKKSILMNGPIRTTGDHTIRVRIHSQVVLDVPVKVIGLEAKKQSEHHEHEDQKAEMPLQAAPDDY